MSTQLGLLRKTNMKSIAYDLSNHVVADFLEWPLKAILGAVANVSRNAAYDTHKTN